MTPVLSSSLWEGEPSPSHGIPPPREDMKGSILHHQSLSDGKRYGNIPNVATAAPCGPIDGLRVLLQPAEGAATPAALANKVGDDVFQVETRSLCAH